MTTDFDSRILLQGISHDPDFPHAPLGWTPQEAETIASQEGLILTAEHWELIRGLQSYFARNVKSEVNLSELHDALEEKFHIHGGLKHLYEILPGGPVAQGCKLAGLKVPSNARDAGGGSVA